MPISIVCDHCFDEFRVKDDLAGKRVRCKSCAEPIRVPGGQTAKPPVKRRQPLVDELDDWDEPEEELPTPRPKAKSKKKRRRSSSQIDFSQMAARIAAINIVPILLQLAGGGLVLMFALGFWYPSVASAFVMTAASMAVLTMIISFFATLWIAGKENPLCMMLCVLPPYYLWFLISRWDRTGGFVSAFFGTWIGGWLLVTGSTAAYAAAGIPVDLAHPPHPGAVAQPSFLPQSKFRSEMQKQVATDLYPVSTVPVPKFTVGDRRKHRGGVQGTYSQVETDGLSHTIPGSRMVMRLHLPEGQHQPQSLPCILIAPAGATLLTGMNLDKVNEIDEKAPYIRAGYAVVEYSVDGADFTTNGPPSTGAYTLFATAQAGVVNGRNALEFVLTNVPEVNPNRIYAAGHSSAAVLALLLTVHEPRIKGCLAYAPAADVEMSMKSKLTGFDAERLYPGVFTFIRRSSPVTHAAHLNCPVFLFHAQDDSNTPISGTRAFYAQLQSLGKQSVLMEATTGGHYEPMIREGIPAGLQWLQQLPGNR